MDRLTMIGARLGGLAGGLLAATALVACSKEPASGALLARQDAGGRDGCPQATLLMDGKGNVFRNGVSVDNANAGAGVPREHVASASGTVKIATTADGSIYWDCEKITQAELDKRFVAARAAAREKSGAAKTPDQNGK